MNGAATVRLGEATLSTARIEAPVQRLLASPTATVLDWSATPLTPGLGVTTSGLLRITGTAAVLTHPDERLSQVPFSLILKGVRRWRDIVAPHHWTYWKREALAYASGLLEHLPDGLRAPTCYGVDELSESEALIWLEDLGSDMKRRWNAANFERAARLLGRLNGQPLPAAFDPPPAWWSRDILRHWVEIMDRRFAQLDVARDDPVLGPLWSDESVTLLRAIRQRAPAMLELLARLPTTLGHGDANPGNFSLPDDESSSDAVLIDWSGVGLRSPGADLDCLLFHAATAHGYDEFALVEIGELAIASYLHGLDDIEWQDDRGVVRPAFAASYALRAGCMPIEALMADPVARAAADRSMDVSMAVRIQRMGQARRYAWRLVQELPIA
jgi:hypothetical protein